MKIDQDIIKDLQIRILEDVHRFCVSNNISYFLTYGTLIGAIRHEGYIPWDDDIDICMPRNDYDRFLDLYNDDGYKYKVVSYEIDNAFPESFAKVIDTETTLVERTDIPYSLGVNIDLFPIDGIDKKGKCNRLQIILRHILNVKKVSLNSERNVIKNIVLLLCKILLKPIKSNHIIRLMIQRSKRLSYKSSDYVACLAIGMAFNKPAKKIWFQEKIEKKFERSSFYVPKGFHEYLNVLYGDYMKLPPENKRVSHHDYDAYLKTSN